MNLIVAADKNWAIGKDNDLLFHIPGDMKMFRKMTMGNVIVMGRRTLESFPGGKPLPGRTNIVLTTRKDYDGKGALAVHSLKELRDVLSAYDTDRVFVVGGGKIYSLLLPCCRYAYVTRVDSAGQADTWMPDLDRDPDWTLKEAGEEMTWSGLGYRFSCYENRKVMSLDRLADE